MPNTYISPPMRLVDTELESDYTRADLQLLGLRHGGASYEGRIFLNNSEAIVDTEPTPKNGYAGCFFVFGHGGCFGEEGHCDVVERAPTDPRPPHPLTPMTKHVTITGAFRELVRPNEPFTVTIVCEPVPYDPPKDDGPYLPEFDVDRENVLEFDRLRIVTYD